MARIPLVEEEITRSVIGGFYTVYNTLRYGFLETIYVGSLECELTLRGHNVAREVEVPIYYRGRRIRGHRIDMVVDGKVVVEAKSSEFLHPRASRQLFNYLRASTLEVGLLLHFGPKPRFERVISLNRR